jgi:hypothetical protein
VRTARARAADALAWGEALRATAPAAEGAGVAELRALALALREAAELEQATERGELPRVGSVAEASALESRLESLGAALGRLEEQCHRPAAYSNAHQTHSPTEGGGGRGGRGKEGKAAAGLLARWADDGGWLFALLRHADAEAARRAFDGSCALAGRQVLSQVLCCL